MLLQQRRYTLVVEQLDDGNWYVGLPAMDLWCTNIIKTIAKKQLRAKINRAIKLIERGKLELADSDALEDNHWYEVRILARDSVHQ